MGVKERYCSSTVAYVPIHMIIDEGKTKKKKRKHKSGRGTHIHTDTSDSERESERESAKNRDRDTSLYSSIYEYRSTCPRTYT